MDTPQPKGVVALLLSPKGQIEAQALDFLPDGLGSLNVREAQRHRACHSLYRAAVRALCASDVVDTFQPYDAEQFVRRLERAGWSVKLLEFDG